MSSPLSEEGSNARPKSCSLVGNACVGDDKKTPLAKMKNAMIGTLQKLVIINVKE